MTPTAARQTGLAKVWLAAMLFALSGCASHAPPPAPTPPSVAAAAPTATRGEFALAAVPLDVWNAIGDIIVRTPGASYDTRSRMLGLYSVRYRGQPLLIVAHALPLSDTVHVLTTQVTAKSPAGAPVDSDVVAELLATLQQELPAEIERVHARQAAEAAAEAAKAHEAKPKARKKKRK
jgi:hypothetical protein